MKNRAADGFWGNKPGGSRIYTLWHLRQIGHARWEGFVVCAEPSILAGNAADSGMFAETRGLSVFGNVRRELKRGNSAFSLRKVSNRGVLVETLVNPLAGLELGAENGIFSQHQGGNLRGPMWSAETRLCLRSFGCLEIGARCAEHDSPASQNPQAATSRYYINSL